MDNLLKTKKEYKKKQKTGGSQYSYQNRLSKACFYHVITCGDFKDLARRTVPYKLLRDKAFNIAKNLKYDGYQRGFASMVCKFFNKKSSGGAFTGAWLRPWIHKTNLVLNIRLCQTNNWLKN